MARSAAATAATRLTGVQRTITVPASGTALLLIDVINDLAFEGSAGLVAQAEPMANRLAALKRRIAVAEIPTLFINDNFGQWRSDFRKTVARIAPHEARRAGASPGVCDRRRATTSC
jgi:nicotinamidase-related amidase